MSARTRWTSSTMSVRAPGASGEVGQQVQPLALLLGPAPYGLLAILEGVDERPHPLGVLDDVGHGVGAPERRLGRGT